MCSCVYFNLFTCTTLCNDASVLIVVFFFLLLLLLLSYSSPKLAHPYESVLQEIGICRHGKKKESI